MKIFLTTVFILITLTLEAQIIIKSNYFDVLEAKYDEDNYKLIEQSPVSSTFEISENEDTLTLIGRTITYFPIIHLTKSTDRIIYQLFCEETKVCFVVFEESKKRITMHFEIEGELKRNLIFRVSEVIR